MTESRIYYQAQGIAQHKVSVAKFKQWIQENGLEGFGTQPSIDQLKFVLIGPLISVIANYATNQLSDNEVVHRVASDPKLSKDWALYGAGNWENDDASIWDDDEAPPGTPFEKRSIAKAKQSERVKGARSLFESDTRMRWRSLIEDAVSNGELTLIDAQGAPVEPEMVLESNDGTQERRLKMITEKGLKVPQYKNGVWGRWEGMETIASAEGISRQSLVGGLKSYLEKTQDHSALR